MSVCACELTWPKKRPTYYLPTYLPTYLPDYLPTYLPCDTDYNTDNWEPWLMTIFVTWQLIVTLDSICIAILAMFLNNSRYFKELIIQEILKDIWFKLNLSLNYFNQINKSRMNRTRNTQRRRCAPGLNPNWLAVINHSLCWSWLIFKHYFIIVLMGKLISLTILILVTVMLNW